MTDDPGPGAPAPDYLRPLPVSALRAAGIPEPWRFGQADRVRFYELDALNHVNNTAYLRWFETLRVQYFAAYGLSLYRPEDPTFVLRAITCDYHAPLFLNDDYIVTARCAAFRETSFRKEYAVWSGGRLCTSGTAVIVLTDAGGHRKRPLTEQMRRLFSERDGAADAR